MEDEIGGRLFFTNQRRCLVDEDEIHLTSVGIDIGSSTSHLAFSRITLERVDARYIVTERQLLFESQILLTPYTDADAIDTEKLAAFLKRQYQLSGIDSTAIDTGALILTGTAIRRKNARAIGELFSEAAGKFVSLSAGDEMEALLAASGSGAVAKSKASGLDVLNVDIGGGTTKIARCVAGAVETLTAIDIGARLLAMDQNGRLTRIEPAGRYVAEECGVPLALGQVVEKEGLSRIAERMADHLIEAMGARPISEMTRSLLRLDPMEPRTAPPIITFSGGVSEYIYNRDKESYGDLGPWLAQQIVQRVRDWGPEIQASVQGIRATVIGASQYTVQVSSSTIFVSDVNILPLRNIPTIKPRISLAPDTPDSSAIAAAVRVALARIGNVDDHDAISLCYSWIHSATFSRIDAFCRGIAEGCSVQISRGKALVIIGDGDIGGLIGVHFAEELGLPVPIVSIDGISLQEFDFVDIGTVLQGSGAVPVIVKSLVFPAADTGGVYRNLPKVAVSCG